ncbi:MAG: phage portal protein [Methylophilaceae bacterium]|nr:phage portal protein [Methyloradius sp.]
MSDQDKANRLAYKGSTVLRDWNAKRELEKKAVQTSAQMPAVFRNTRRSFNAGGVSRNTASWITADVALNALLEAQLAVIRARSRSLAQNTATGRRFMTLVKNNVAGPAGFRLQSKCGDYRSGKWALDKQANEAIETGWAKWCKAKNCDITGQFDFATITRMVAEGAAKDGEFLVREIIGTKANAFRYQLQLLSIERLDINYRGVASNGNNIRMGVEKDSTGKPVGYYVLERNPNDAFIGNSMQKHVRIDATDIIHRFIPLDPEQTRGVPWAHAVMTGQNMLHLFEEAAVGNAVVGAQSMGFYVPPAAGENGYAPPTEDGYGAEVADAMDADGNLMKDAVGGAFETLPPGWDFKQFNPAYPATAFDPFVQSRKRDMAAGLDVAHHNLSGDMSGVNYSSARIAELSERDNWRAIQNWLISVFAQRVAERWLEISLLAGAIVLPTGSALPATRLDKFIDGLSFTGRGWDWVDPLKEVNASKIAIDEGLTTRTQVVASKGGDFEENVIELEREQELIAEHNLTLGGKATDPASTLLQEDPVSQEKK